MPADVISREEANELKATMRELTTAVNQLSQQVAVHNAEQRPFETLVAKHEKALYGDGGLVAKTDRLERGMENINKAAWAFFAPFISLVFIGILVAVYLALKGGLP